MTTTNAPGDRPHIQSLVVLGLTSLEAEVYTFFLMNSDSTAYAAAKGLSKPAANVYKAVEALQAKGAILVDEGDKRTCRAVPAADFLERLANAFNSHRRRAEDVLSRLPGPPSDARVYQIRSTDHVFDHARRMLDSAKTIVLMDAFPKPLVELSPDIESTVRRGVNVVIKIYAPAKVRGANLILAPDGDHILERWPAQWLNVVADGAEFMLALLTDDARHVVQAASSESPYLAWVHHSQFACELAYSAIEDRLKSGADASEIRQTFDRTRGFFAPDAVGYRRVLAQLEAVAPPLPDTRR